MPDDEIRLRLRVRPGARTETVGGRWDGPNGVALLVSVRARAVDGKANNAVMAAIAEELGVRRADVELIAGLRGRDKTVRIVGDVASIRERYERLLG